MSMIELRPILIAHHLLVLSDGFSGVELLSPKPLWALLVVSAVLLALRLSKWRRLQRHKKPIHGAEIGVNVVMAVMQTPETMTFEAIANAAWYLVKAIASAVTWHGDDHDDSGTGYA